MKERSPMKFVLTTIGMFGISVVPGLAHSQALVTPTVTKLSNGFYHYNYSIKNLSADDLFDVDIQVQPGASIVTNVSAPTGFITAYDTGLGLVSYLEDTGTFSKNIAISGFVYDSLLSPALSTYTANQAPTAGGITALNGVTPAAVPEPGNIALIGAISMVSLFALRRKRR